MKWAKDLFVSFFSSKKAIAGTLAGFFIPALYCFLYLNAIWDPQGKLDQVPAVLVNQDQAVDDNGEKLSLGADLTRKLLNDKKLKWTELKDPAEAEQGVADGTYYLMIDIPAGFSQGVADLTNQSGDQAKLQPIRYVSNQGQSLIVSQIGDRMMEVLREQVNDQIAEKAMGKLISAARAAQAGFGQAANGAAQLADGAGAAAAGAAKLDGALEQAANGAASLSGGAKKAANGGEQLAAGLAQLQQGQTQAAQQLAGAAPALQQLETQLQALAEAPGTAEAQKPALAQLAAQTHALAAGLAQGQGGLERLAAGGAQAAEQAKALASGLTQLQQGVAQLDEGLGRAQGGSEALAGNLGKLQDGLQKMSSELTQGANAGSGLKDIEHELVQPVDISKEPVNPVANNGTFFSGFFAPLSLWVGGIVFTALTLMAKWKGWARRSLLPRYLLLGALGVVQSLILDWTLIKVLGVQVESTWELIGLTILTSLTFISIIHFVIGMIGVAGNVVVLLLLVFQLGLCGGSYPTVMLTSINESLSHWVPLYYAVGGFRSAISGSSAAYMHSQIVHLAYFLAAGLGLHVAYGGISRLSRTVRKSQAASALPGEATSV